MSAKLYKYDKNRITETMEFEELSVEAFDALESEHVFSEAYQEKKNHLLNSYQQRESQHPYRGRVKAAMIVLAVLFVSGTAAAVSSNYLRQAYENKHPQIDPKYWLTDFTDSNYEFPVTVETTDTEDLLDFRVLQAAKGEHTISLAMLVTANDPNLVLKGDHYWTAAGSPGMVGDLEFDIRFDGKQHFPLSGRGWGSQELELGLPDNQFLAFCEITYNQTLDLTKVDSFDLDIYLLHYDREDETVTNVSRSDKMWTLHIPIDRNYNEYVYEIDQQYNIFFDYSIKIKEIQLTPSHLTLYFEPLAGKKTTEAVMNINPEKTKLLMADGSKIALEQISDSYERVSHLPIEETIDFKIPLDTDQIIGLEFDGVEVRF